MSPLSLFSKLFNKTEEDKSESRGKTEEQSQMINDIIHQKNSHFDDLAAGKSPSATVPKEVLLQIFAEYFAPNTEFYSPPDSEKAIAYFNAVHKAQEEMFSHQTLFYESTKWSSEQLSELVNNPKPGITNMMICGLIFLLGQFAVIKDAVYCVDFSEKIPNCIALYLLLIAQKQPEDKRNQLIDAGDGAAKTLLSEAMDSLKVCDPLWKYQIW